MEQRGSSDTAFMSGDEKMLVAVCAGTVASLQGRASQVEGQMQVLHKCGSVQVRSQDAGQFREVHECFDVIENAEHYIDVRKRFLFVCLLATKQSHTAASSFCISRSLCAQRLKSLFCWLQGKASLLQNILLSVKHISPFVLTLPWQRSREILPCIQL